MSILANRRNFLFEEVKQTAPERNGFDLSHENKQTCRAGKVYPFEILEALPNDDFEIQVEQFVRLQPMLSPTMHRVKSYWHWFFMPNRLTWKYWEEFISRGNGKKLPANQEYTPPEPPQISFFDLLQLTPTFNELRFDTVEGNGSYDDAVAFFQTRFPQYGYIHNVTVIDSNNTGSGTFEHNTLICHRTPRMANALSVPDTMIPFGYIHRNGDNGDYWLVRLDDNVTFNGSLPDQLDAAVTQLKSVNLSLMPFVAYFRIWTEYYRDENLDDDYTKMLDYFYNLTGVVNFATLTTTEFGYFKRLFYLNYRCWEKDYFTTATQLPQKSPDVEIPGTGSSTVNLSATTTISGDDNTAITGSAYYYDSVQPDNLLSNSDATFKSGFNNLFDSNNKIIDHSHNQTGADLATHLTASTTINSVSGESLQPTTVAQVRRAFALQRWFEKAVRTGTRYIESLKAFFNSDAGDARLQRAEYIGGSSSPIQISDVVQTSATDDNSDTVQGNLAGYGMSSDSTDVIRYHAPEHGFIIGCFSILARTSYSQGLPRLFSRETWLDYAWPEFEHIGEQAIRQKELAIAPLSNRLMNNTKLYGQFYGSYQPELNDIFGYQSRYSEYKQMPDRFGAGFGSTLDFWSLGRVFDSAPTLSPEFVHAQISDRNFAVVGNDVENQGLNDGVTQGDRYDESYDYDTYVADFWLDIKKVTSLTLYSEPI